LRGFHSECETLSSDFKIVLLGLREIKNSSTTILSADISSWTACVDTWAANTVFIRTASPTVISNLATCLIGVAISVALPTTNNAICFERREGENKEENAENR